MNRQQAHGEKQSAKPCGDSRPRLSGRATLGMVSAARLQKLHSRLQFFLRTCEANVGIIRRQQIANRTLVLAAASLMYPAF